MQPLPATSLRSNLGTWAVPNAHLPGIANVMLHALSPEGYDPLFQGQKLETTYFDTRDFDLRKARVNKNRYLTLRLRCYQKEDGAEVYALSAKTEDQKWRKEIDPQDADAILHDDVTWTTQLLPADLQARLLELAGDNPVLPVVCIYCRRYAVEDKEDRLTLDVGFHTDTGKALPHAVLEFKSTDVDATPPGRLPNVCLRPIKLSKFLWSTEA